MQAPEMDRGIGAYRGEDPIHLTALRIPDHLTDDIPGLFACSDHHPRDQEGEPHQAGTGSCCDQEAVFTPIEPHHNERKPSDEEKDPQWPGVLQYVSGHK